MRIFEKKTPDDTSNERCSQWHWQYTVWCNDMRAAHFCLVGVNFPRNNVWKWNCACSGISIYTRRVHLGWEKIFRGLRIVTIFLILPALLPTFKQQWTAYIFVSIYILEGGKQKWSFEQTHLVLLHAYFFLPKIKCAANFSLDLLRNVGPEMWDLPWIKVSGLSYTRVWIVWATLTYYSEYSNVPYYYFVRQQHGGSVIMYSNLLYEFSFSISVFLVYTICIINIFDDLPFSRAFCGPRSRNDDVAVSCAESNKGTVHSYVG